MKTTTRLPMYSEMLKSLLSFVNMIAFPVLSGEKETKLNQANKKQTQTYPNKINKQKGFPTNKTPKPPNIKQMNEQQKNLTDIHTKAPTTMKEKKKKTQKTPTPPPE